MKLYIELLGTSEQIDEIKKITRANKKVRTTVSDYRIINLSLDRTLHSYSLMLKGSEKQIKKVSEEISSLNNVF